MTVKVFYDQQRVEQLRQQGIAPRRQLTGGSSSPQTALEAVEECARLRAENRRLTDEVDRLRREVDRLSGRPSGPVASGSRDDLDDAALRFSLLDLDR